MLILGGAAVVNGLTGKDQLGLLLVHVQVAKNVLTSVAPWVDNLRDVNRIQQLPVGWNNSPTLAHTQTTCR